MRANIISCSRMHSFISSTIFTFSLGIFLSGSFLQAMEVHSEVKPFAVYDEDNRREIFESSPFWQNIGRSVAGKVSLEQIGGGGKNGNLIGSPLRKRVCSGTRFENQLTVPTCTGFLVKKNLIVTAGHCVKSQLDCDEFAWVFDFKLKNSGDQGYTHVGSENIYRCIKIQSRRYEQFGAVDYAILELDRSVEGREPLKLGFSFEIKPGTSLAMIGHPTGLPLKLTDSAQVFGLASNDLAFESNLDTFQGNSGSPVFEAETGQVIGITSHGHEDFHKAPGSSCRSIKVCKPEDGCYRATSSRISNLQSEPSLN